MRGTASLEWSLLPLITLILIAASLPKKAALENIKPGPDAVRAPECSKGLPQEPGGQPEKKTSEHSLGSRHSSELEKKLDAEKAVEEGGETGQVESSALQESPGARGEAVFLHEMVRWTHCLVQLKFFVAVVCVKNQFLPRGLYGTAF